MGTSVSGTIARRKIWVLIFSLTLYVPLPRGLIVAQQSVAKSSKSTTTPPKTAPVQSPSKPAGKSDTRQPGAAGQVDKPLPAAPSNQSSDSKSQDAKDQTPATPPKASAPDPEAVKVFWYVFFLISGLLLLMLLVVGISLVAGKWSLGEALSEESSVQPTQGQVKTLPSTSRFIALFGLLGILTTVLGIGYATIWSLILYQKPPEKLSEVRSFLLGAACLFAPYLANQLRAAFENSPGRSGADGAADPNAANPNAPNANAANPNAPNANAANPNPPNVNAANPNAPNANAANPNAPNANAANPNAANPNPVGP